MSEFLYKKLEVVCPRCQGSGRITLSRGDIDNCPSCGGARIVIGYEPVINSQEASACLAWMKATAKSLGAPNNINSPLELSHFLTDWIDSARRRDPDLLVQNINTLIYEYDRMRNHVGGCTNGDCMIKRPVGMHTNSCCKCNRDHLKSQRMMRAGQKLRDEIEEAVNHF